MAEEVFDLLKRDIRQIRIILHLFVTTRQLGRRHCDDLLISARFVFHEEHANNAAAHDGPGNNRASIGDNHIARIAILRKRMGNEAVIAGISHRRIEKAINNQRAGLFVHFILDRFATNRNLNDDVHFLRRIFANRDCVQAHAVAPKLFLRSELWRRLIRHKFNFVATVWGTQKPRASG